MQAIQIEAFGNPAEVMKLVDIPDVGAPGEGEVVIALEASPINMSDLLMISGRYGYRPQLPSVMGTEGVGRVIAVGSSVRHLKQGDRTLVPYPAPAWAERIRVDASRLRPLPNGDDPEQRQFRRRAGVDSDREIAWFEDRQCRAARGCRRRAQGARR